MSYIKYAIFFSFSPNKSTMAEEILIDSGAHELKLGSSIIQGNSSRPGSSEKTYQIFKSGFQPENSEIDIDKGSSI